MNPPLRGGYRSSSYPSSTPGRPVRHPSYWRSFPSVRVLSGCPVPTRAGKWIYIRLNCPGGLPQESDDVTPQLGRCACFSGLRRHGRRTGLPWFQDPKILLGSLLQFEFVNTNPIDVATAKYLLTALRMTTLTFVIMHACARLAHRDTTLVCNSICRYTRPYNHQVLSVFSNADPSTWQPTALK